jgi:hypothetical protein
LSFGTFRFRIKDSKKKQNDEPLVTTNRDLEWSKILFLIVDSAKISFDENKLIEQSVYHH